MSISPCYEVRIQYSNHSEQSYRVRPVSFVGLPDSRPCSASFGHMGQVEDGDMICICGVGLDANRFTTSTAKAPHQQ